MREEGGKGLLSVTFYAYFMLGQKNTAQLEYGPQWLKPTLILDSEEKNKGRAFQWYKGKYGNTPKK